MDNVKLKLTLNDMEGRMASQPLESRFASDRGFQVWEYAVSHCQLFLRANKEDRWPTRIGLLFKAVEFMAVPRSFPAGVTIRPCDPSEDDFPQYLRAHEIKGRWYRLAGPSQVGYVAAGALFMSEDDLEYGDPTVFDGWHHENARPLS